MRERNRDGGEKEEKEEEERRREKTNGDLWPSEPQKIAAADRYWIKCGYFGSPLRSNVYMRF